MVDVGEELLRAVRVDFRQELGDSGSRLAKLLKRIQGGKGTMHDAALFSKECGAALSEAIAKNVTPDRLPNGTLYYNIAEKILGGTLRDNYDLLNMVAQAVQEQTDSKLNIRIEPQKAEFPQERVHKIINAAADQTADSETIKRRLDSPVRNVTESFFDDYVEENARFRDEAGLQTYLVRQTNGKCCDWCASLAGRFRYEDAPEGIFARHDNCTCTVDYITRTYRQDVWSKRKYALTPEQRKEILNSTPKPTRFTKEQAKNLQNQVLNGVANSGGSGIIEVESKPITSIKQAHDFLNTVFASVEKSVSKLDEHLIIVNAEQLRKLNSKFGVLTKENTGYISGRKIKAIAEVSQDPSSSNNSLTLSSTYYKQSDILEEAAIRNQKSFFSAPVADEYLLVETITHEYGHMLENSIIRNRIRSELFEGYRNLINQGKSQSVAIAHLRQEERNQAEQIYHEIINIAKQNNPEFKLSDHLSRYGKTNRFEAFAEMFMNSQCGKPNELGDAMNIFLERCGYK